jgi:hypothetical protein
MKKLLTTLLVAGSTVALAACASDNNFDQTDETLTQAPFAEERTVGASEAPVRRAPVVRSAQPVFESRQVK